MGELHPFRPPQSAATTEGELLAQIAHELRSPLAAIMGLSELLLDSDLDEQQRRWVRTVRGACKHLTLLVEDALGASSPVTDALAIALEPVPVRPLLEEALELIRPLAATSLVNVEPPAIDACCDIVWADRHRLMQVLINLLTNAIKYNRAGGDVRICVRPVAGDRLRLSVEDSGIGIDETALTKLFVPFERLNAAAAGIQGTGLGLALSRQLVEAMDGSISVASTLDRGSAFSVELTRAEPAGQRTLLYIDDAPGNPQLLADLLSYRPRIQLLHAMAGGEGLERARKRRPDLILLDLQPGHIDGARMLAQLRADPACADIPMVVMGSAANEEERSLLMEAGASACLSIPTGAPQWARLLDLVDEFLGDVSPVESRERSTLAAVA